MIFRFTIIMVTRLQVDQKLDRDQNHTYFSGANQAKWMPCLLKQSSSRRMSSCDIFATRDSSYPFFCSISITCAFSHTPSRGAG